MIFGTSNILGLAMRERSILAAEVRVSGERRDVVRMAEFALPPELSLRQPPALGKALRQFLKQHGFSAGRAVVGVPARWLIAREKDVPPATPATAANVLRLAAEREFSAELKEMVFDYAGQPDPSAPRKVLLVAMLREHLDQINELADAAGLSVVAVAPSALALAGAASQNGELSMVLSGGAADLAACGQRAGRVLRHLPVTDGPDRAAAVASLGGEIQRVLSTMPAQAGTVPPSSLVVWDGGAFDPAAATSLQQRIGLRVHVEQDVSRLNVQVSGEPAAALQFAPAIALALAGVRRELLPLDFARSRLAPPRTRRLGRRTRWAAAAAVLLALGLGWLILDVQLCKGRLADLDAALASLDPSRKAAEAMRAKVSAANGWYTDGRPPYLGCMKQVTQVFGEDSRVWGAAITLKEGTQVAGRAETRVVYRGTLSAKAVDESSMNDLVKRLLSNASFAEVKRDNWQHASGSSRDTFVAFSVSFTYIGAE